MTIDLSVKQTQSQTVTQKQILGSKFVEASDVEVEEMIELMREPNIMLEVLPFGQASATTTEKEGVYVARTNDPGAYEGRVEENLSDDDEGNDLQSS